MLSVREFADMVHMNAVDKGFWDRGAMIPEKLCLIHSEVSEAMEADRALDGGNFGEELADIVIRVFDLAIGCGIDIEGELEQKHFKNLNRPRLHGKRY